MSTSVRVYDNKPLNQVEISTQMCTYSSYLHQFLKDHLSKDQSLISKQRKAAQEKLSKLTVQQFHELATDVYDESSRREVNDYNVPFLPVRTEYHPKRNQARQKLATLVLTKFKDLAADVLFEIDRRFPEATTTSSLGISKNTESLKNEDDPLNLESLDNLMADLGEMITKRSQNIPEPSNKFQTEKAERAEREKDSSDQVRHLQDKIRRLEAELNAAKYSDKVDTDTLSKQLEEQKKIVAQQENTIYELQNNYKMLKDDHKKQISLSDDLKKELTNLQADMKSLLKKIEVQSNEKEIAKETIQKLLEEKTQLSVALKEAQFELNRYLESNTVTPTRKKTISMTEQNSEFSYIFDTSIVSTYLSAVDDLNKAAKSNIPSDILVSMKAIVLAVRQINDAADQFEQALKAAGHTDGNEFDRIRSLRGALSSQLSNLITQAKQSATSPSSEAASLVQQHSTKLTSTVAEMAEFITEKTKTFQGAPAEREVNLPKIKANLEKSTDSIIQAIQDLLLTMKNTNEAEELGDIVESVASSVGQITQYLSNLCRNELSTHNEKDRIIKQSNLLETNADKLESFFRKSSSEYIGSSGKIDHLIKQKIASSAYDVAKSTKELISLF